MIFVGRIRRASAIHRLWRENARVGGMVDGVAFHFVQGGNFETGVLSAAEVVRLQRHPDVEVATIAADLPTEAPPSPSPVPPPPATGGSYASRLAGQRRRSGQGQGLKVW